MKTGYFQLIDSKGSMFVGVCEHICMFCNSLTERVWEQQLLVSMRTPSIQILAFKHHSPLKRNKIVIQG